MDFPLVHALWNGSNNFYDQNCFVYCISSNLSTIEYSTLIGGTSSDYVYDAILDVDGGLYLAGLTSSHDFPLENPLNSSSDSSNSEGYVTKIQGFPPQIVASSFINGFVDGITIDEHSTVYLACSVFPPDMVTENEHVPAYIDNIADFLVMGCTANLESKIFETRIPGNSSDFAAGITLGPNLSLVIYGNTESTDLPCVSSFQPGPQGSTDMYVYSLDIDSPTNIFSTYIGGREDDIIVSVVCEKSGDILVFGYTYSKNIPTYNDQTLNLYNSSEIGFDSNCYLMRMPFPVDSDSDSLSDFAESYYGTDVLNLDSDGDQMPDAWEIRYGLDPLFDDASEDLDEDGLTNLEEFLQGSNPNDLDSIWIHESYTPRTHWAPPTSYWSQPEDYRLEFWFGLSGFILFGAAFIRIYNKRKS